MPGNKRTTRRNKRGGGMFDFLTGSSSMNQQPVQGQGSSFFGSSSMNQQPGQGMFTGLSKLNPFTKKSQPQGYPDNSSSRSSMESYYPTNPSTFSGGSRRRHRKSKSTKKRSSKRKSAKRG